LDENLFLAPGEGDVVPGEASSDAALSTTRGAI